MNSFVLIISNILSIITITSCFIMKVPQILRIYKSQSSVGLSSKALILELASYTTTAMYNFTSGNAALTYLEYPVLIIQEYIMIALVLKYSNHSFTTFLGVLLLFGSITLGFGYGVLSKSILKLLLPLTTPVGGLSKVVQLLEILRAKNADSVSAITWFISVFTNAARIFTVWVDSADFNLLMNFSVSTILSSSVLIAVVYYQRLAKSAIGKKGE